MVIQTNMKEGWYLLKTKPRKERSAFDHLENQGFEAYCPSIPFRGPEVSVLSVVSDVKEEVLFGGYIFLYLALKDLDKYHKIRSTRGVSEIISFNKMTRQLYADGRISVRELELYSLLPQPIPCGETIIEQIKEMVECLQKSYKEKNSFSEGERVIISNPLYEHLKATFVKGLSSSRGLILIEHIKQQRNARGIIRSTSTMSVKTVAINIDDLQKEDGHQET
ncbi:MAG: transcription termination/antitermination NusG family protein [Candidatus Endonucleobacter sp. (ex Gigantidas childressi)]|nr:transcription termination/antitermination NusG family protein [Candidatus Endonucleobacter sp. (ex Gigantidas childressi)]